MSFLRGLPLTIRTEVFLPVIMYAVRTNPRPVDTIEDFDPIVDRFLSASGSQAIAAVLCTIAVLDFSLEDQQSKLDNAETALSTLTARDPENLAFQQSHLSFPMRRKHWEQASVDWLHLRQTKLSLQTLQDFEHNQLMRPTLRSKGSDQDRA